MEHETFWDLLQNAAHWEFELFLVFLVDVVIGLLVWPLLKRAYLHHPHHKSDDDKIAVLERKIKVLEDKDKAKEPEPAAWDMDRIQMLDDLRRSAVLTFQNQLTGDPEVDKAKQFLISLAGLIDELPKEDRCLLLTASDKSSERSLTLDQRAKVTRLRRQLAQTLAHDMTVSE